VQRTAVDALRALAQSPLVPALLGEPLMPVEMTASVPIVCGIGLLAFSR